MRRALAVPHVPLTAIRTVSEWVREGGREGERERGREGGRESGITGQYVILYVLRDERVMRSMYVRFEFRCHCVCYSFIVLTEI